MNLYGYRFLINYRNKITFQWYSNLLLWTCSFLSSIQYYHERSVYNVQRTVQRMVTKLAAESLSAGGNRWLTTAAAELVENILELKKPELPNHSWSIKKSFISLALDETTASVLSEPDLDWAQCTSRTTAWWCKRGKISQDTHTQTHTAAASKNSTKCIK